MFWKILLNFPRGFQGIIQDVKLFLLIQDAARSPRNAWTKNIRPIAMDRFSMFHIYSHIPRQQQEFQRRLKRDLRKVLVPVLGYTLLPIVGNLFILLPALAPRRFSSRHFLDDPSMYMIASQEYQQRKKWYAKISRDFWMSTMIPAHILDQLRDTMEMSRNQEGQACIMDLSSLFHIVLPSSNSVSSSTTPLSSSTMTLFHPSLMKLSSSQLYDLSRAYGITSSSFFTHMVPKSHLRKRLLSIADDIIQDDAILLRENHHTHQCALLNDEEVLDACLLRGLPIDHDSSQMRVQLTKYLYSIEPWSPRLQRTTHTGTDHKQQEAHRDAVCLFVLLLPALRYNFE
jgi:hypothetical protein